MGHAGPQPGGTPVHRKDRFLHPYVGQPDVFQQEPEYQQPLYVQDILISFKPPLPLPKIKRKGNGEDFFG